jgi:hypothetical protein
LFGNSGGAMDEYQPFRKSSYSQGSSPDIGGVNGFYYQDFPEKHRRLCFLWQRPEAQAQRRSSATMLYSLGFNLAYEGQVKKKGLQDTWSLSWRAEEAEENILSATRLSGYEEVGIR